MTHGFDAPVLLTVEDGGKSFRVYLSNIYRGSQGDAWVIPQGFSTDFATIPAAVSWAVPKLGAYSLAAIVHDLLCEGLNAYYRAQQVPYAPIGVLTNAERSYLERIAAMTPRPTANAVDTDAIFYKIARDFGTDPVTANLLWVGVRWGALANPARREGFFRRDVFCRWLGLSLVFAPVLLPATVLAVVGRGVLRLARRIFR